VDVRSAAWWKVYYNQGILNQESRGGEGKLVRETRNSQRSGGQIMLRVDVRGKKGGGVAVVGECRR
jgi:hypothetical protein